MEKDTTIDNNKTWNDLSNENLKSSIFSVLSIEWNENKIIWKTTSKVLWLAVWLEFNRNIDVYFLEWTSERKWAFNTKDWYIILYENADIETIKHELIHSLEYPRKIPEELNEFYNKVKETITEDSFENWSFSFNFMKNIHEFIADWYSKSVFQDALKKEGLYDEFLEKTNYIFI